MGQIRTEPATAESFLRRIKEDGVEFLFAMFVDMHGKPCAKLIPAQAAEQFLSNGVGFAGHAAGAMGQTPADPDLIALPDFRSYTLAPWQPGLAIVQTDIHVDGGRGHTRRG